MSEHLKEGRFHSGTYANKKEVDITADNIGRQRRTVTLFYTENQYFLSAWERIECLWKYPQLWKVVVLLKALVFFNVKMVRLFLELLLNEWVAKVGSPYYDPIARMNRLKDPAMFGKGIYWGVDVGSDKKYSDSDFKWNPEANKWEIRK